MSHGQAVLEHYHAANMLRILSKPESNVLKIYKPDEVKKFKELMIHGVLSTDMSRHNSQIEEFKSRNNKFDKDNFEDKMVSQTSNFPLPNFPLIFLLKKFQSKKSKKKIFC